MSREQLFRDAIRENGSRIVRICNWYFTDPDDCSDACQECLVRIWENIHSFKGKCKLSTWIYRVAVNTCLSHIRSENRRRSLFDTAAITQAMQVAESPREEEPGGEERIAFLQQQMEGLNTADRTLLSLYQEDLSTKDMSEITGITESNVRVRIHRIKEKIKKDWEDKEHGKHRKKGS